MEVLPGVGWANSIPDADVTVNMTVHGSTLSFIGTGYHDKVRDPPLLSQLSPTDRVC